MFSATELLLLSSGVVTKHLLSLTILFHFDKRMSNRLILFGWLSVLENQARQLIIVQTGYRGSSGTSHQSQAKDAKRQAECGQA